MKKRLLALLLSITLLQGGTLTAFAANNSEEPTTVTWKYSDEEFTYGAAFTVDGLLKNKTEENWDKEIYGFTESKNVNFVTKGSALKIEANPDTLVKAVGLQYNVYDKSGTLISSATGDILLENGEYSPIPTICYGSNYKNFYEKDINSLETATFMGYCTMALETGKPVTITFDKMTDDLGQTFDFGNPDYIYEISVAWDSINEDYYSIISYKFAVVPENEVTGEDNISDWAKDEVNKAITEGLVTENTNSGYQNATTREQFAELIVNMVEKTLEKELEAAPVNTFTDTNDTNILKAYKAGIINGVGDGRFAPETTTNREQIASMIYRATEFIKANSSKDLTPNKADLSKYTDKNSVSSWALESVGELAANQIMSGTSDTSLSPKSSCTVEQSILLIYRVFQKTK